MCQECQKEMSRPVKFILWVVFFGLGSYLYAYIAMYHDDLFRPFREHRVELRMKTLKVEGYTAIGPSISWQSSEGSNVPVNRPPRIEDKQWEGFNFPPLPPEAFAASHPPAK